MAAAPTGVPIYSPAFDPSLAPHHDAETTRIRLFALSCMGNQFFSRVEQIQNGKHRRYTLLFAVNGGTLAIAQYLAGDLKAGPAKIVAGNLTIQRLSTGMVIFTIIMIWDIYAFGSTMHKRNCKFLDFQDGWCYAQ